MEEVKKFSNLSEKDFKNLENYVNFLISYNQKINLIGKSTIEDIWTRHILDSLQLNNVIKNKYIKVADLGSGAGLPAIPLSISGIKEIHLFEKSPCKSQFLEQAKIYSNNKILVRNENLNNIQNKVFDLVISRALADLTTLLKFSQKLSNDKTELIFLKGKKIYEEIEEAKKVYNFEYELFDSITSNEGKIIKISNFVSL